MLKNEEYYVRVTLGTIILFGMIMPVVILLWRLALS